MTTRKVAALAGLAVAVLGGLAGCATPGPMHVYSLGTGGERAIADVGDGRTASSPSYLKAEDRVTGFAYDPFTDHFFLRLEPGHRIRVVDRPARKIKREFEIRDEAARAPGDLAARPIDGHLFLLGTPAGTIVETTRFGKPVRTFALASTSAAPIGLALDPVRKRLLALAPDGRRVALHDLAGQRLGEIALAAPAGAGLGYDAERRELYAALRDRPREAGVFDEEGRLLRTVPVESAFVDVGVRSFLRVF